MPEDLNLDGGDNKDKDDGGDGGPEEENPFDIDAMKEDAGLNEDEGQEQENGKDDVDQADEEPSDAPFEPMEENPAPANEEESGGEEGKEKEIEESAEGDTQQPAEPVDEALPSKDQPSEAEAQPASDQAVKGSQDKTAPKEMADNEPEEEGGQNQEADNDETEGVGMAESRQTEGHEGQQQSKVNRKRMKEKEEDAAGKGKPKKPGQSDPNRALADARKERVLQVGAFFNCSNRSDDNFISVLFDRFIRFTRPSQNRKKTRMKGPTTTRTQSTKITFSSTSKKWARCTTPWRKMQPQRIRPRSSSLHCDKTMAKRKTRKVTTKSQWKKMKWTSRPKPRIN